MLWRYKVTGIRRADGKSILLKQTFNYDVAMDALSLWRKEFHCVYSEVHVEFPFWSRN